MNILVLDDDSSVRDAVKLVLGVEHKLHFASSISEALTVLDKEEVDLGLIDINLNDAQGSGVDFLENFKKQHPEKPALMVSGLRDVPMVVRCMKLGADDYVEKPFEADTIRVKVNKVLAESKQKRVYRRAFDKAQAEEEIIGKNSKLLAAKAAVEEALGMRILFYGETGVGKTPFAKLANQVVNRLTGEVRPFEQINCAALNTEQFQDQLFGHKKGAFTGALTDKKGLVEIAKGGDLFLDEIGEMPLETQALFLTFLDSMEYYRLGDDVKRKADVRILAATNRDLKKCVEEGRFRKDLYSRISQVVVEIPALRDRKEDIHILFEFFVKRFAGYQKPYDPKVIEVLSQRTWQEGNVRELQDIAEYLCVKSQGAEKIGVEHFGIRFLAAEKRVDLPMEPAYVMSYEEVMKAGLESYLNTLERQVLEQCLAKYTGTLDEMARDLRVSRPTLYRRLKHHRISGSRVIATVENLPN